MYSVVLMAALTSGGEAPGWPLHHHNSGYGTCTGAGYGTGYNSCYGGCYGVPFNCFGGSGGYTTGYGCMGSCQGGYGLIGYSPYGCHGCYGCYGCFGCSGYAPGYVPGFGTGLPLQTPGRGDTLPPPRKEGDSGAVAPNRARVIVELPPDAKLFIDDQPTTATSGTRTFNTPELEKGQTYYYVLRAEVVRAGKPISETRRLIIRPGEEVRATFKEPDITTTAKGP
jgi:uncharacterized protein (TIGR03000 family)